MQYRVLVEMWYEPPEHPEAWAHYNVGTLFLYPSAAFPTALDIPHLVATGKLEQL